MGLAVPKPVRGKVIVGAPDSVCARLRELTAGLGLNGVLAELNCGGLVSDDKVMADVEALKVSFEESIARLEQRFENKVDKVQRGKGNYGYNASTGEYGDMVAMGVLDPTKVTRYALQNAASVAALILTTDAMVAELPKDDKPQMGGGGGGMGGMGDMDM